MEDQFKPFADAVASLALDLIIRPIQEGLSARGVAVDIDTLISMTHVRIERPAVRASARSVEVVEADDNQCVYIFSKGNNAGSRCKGRKSLGQDYCSSCLSKKSVTRALGITPATQPAARKPRQSKTDTAGNLATASEEITYNATPFNVPGLPDELVGKTFLITPYNYIVYSDEAAGDTPRVIWRYVPATESNPNAEIVNLSDDDKKIIQELSLELYGS